MDKNMSDKLEELVSKTPSKWGQESDKRVKDKEDIMFDILRQMYKEADPSADFDSLMEKATINERGQKDIHFESYYLSQERQDQIIEEQLKGRRLTKIKKQMIKNSMYLGCFPCSVDFYYRLTRTDGLVKEAKRVRWITFGDDLRFKDWYNDIQVGRSLLMSPFNDYFTWQTTLVTEVLADGKFKTENSEYKLERIIIKDAE